MAEVVLSHVTKRFGEVVALDDLSLPVHDKEFLVLVGPSGCGKTTALRLIAGLEELTVGDIYIDGRLVNDVVPKDRDIAMVFQSYALYPHMSVYENIAFGLEVRRLPRQEVGRRVKRAAEILGISELLKRKPRQLSGGQRQRVALGRAIVREPKVFLMDEPLSNLDAKLRAHTRTEIIRLHQRLEATIIYVTHDQVEAMTMGSRIAILRDGILQQLDEPQVVFSRPANIFVAGFIGSPPMNFFTASLLQEGDGLFLLTKGFKIRLMGERASKLRDYGKKEVILGIRPEDIYDRQHFSATSAESTVEALVDVVELLGSEVLLNLAVGGENFVARMDVRTRVKPGEKVELVFDVEKLALFDPESERAIES